MSDIPLHRAVGVLLVLVWAALAFLWGPTSANRVAAARQQAELTHYESVAAGRLDIRAILANGLWECRARYSFDEDSVEVVRYGKTLTEARADATAAVFTAYGQRLQERAAWQAQPVEEASDE